MQRYLTDCTLCVQPADSGIESQSTGKQGAKAGPADPRPLPNSEAMRLDRPLPEFFGAYELSPEQLRLRQFAIACGEAAGESLMAVYREACGV